MSGKACAVGYADGLAGDVRNALNPLLLLAVIHVVVLPPVDGVWI